jgi:hypothetical protein
LEERGRADIIGDVWRAVRRQVTDRFAGNPGLRILFDGLVVMTALARGKSSRSAAETRGMNGDVNLVFTGDGGATWHLHMEPGVVRFRAGPSDTARATLEMSVEEFFQLLTGQRSLMVSQMAGRVRVRGEGHALMTVASVVAELRAGRRAPGRAGAFSRRWTDLALRLSGTGLSFEQEGAHR